MAHNKELTPIAELTRATTAAPSRTRVRDLLIVAEVAMTLLLLVTATLLTRSFAAINNVDPGFRSDRVLSLLLAIPRAKYRSDAAVADFCRVLVERVSTLPDVESAGMVNRLPLAGGTDVARVQFEGIDEITYQIDSRSVTPDYFRALGIPLVRGRWFTDADTAQSTTVGIIDERLARAVWGEANPIGRRFRIAVDKASWVTIVGVVGHIHHDALEADLRPQVYWHSLQRPMDRMALVVKTRGEPSAVTQAIVDTIRTADPEQPVYDVRPLDAVVARSLAPRWLQTTLLAIFAGLALLLATLGVYGVISYSVGQRRREFGIRLALGAERRDIVAMVVRRGTRLTIIGLALGIAGAAAASRVMASLLFAVAPLDAVSFATATLLLAVVALTACYLPARRAARVDPTLALRLE
jgi:putative ABC transport system permease protein